MQSKEELEETIKRLKKSLKETTFITDVSHKDLEIALNYIENSIPKEKVANKIKDLVIEEESEYFDNRKTIKILQELLKEK